MSFYYRLFVFLFGVLLGVFLALWVHDGSKHIKVKLAPKGPVMDGRGYKKWFEGRGMTHKKVPWDELRYSNKTFNVESDYLLNTISITCFILVRNDYYASEAKRTWARECNSTYFMSMPDYKLPIKRKSYSSSWSIMCNYMFFVQTQFDWAIVIQDRTFVILPNLRYFVAALDPNKSYYLGHTTTFWGHDYNSGQAGYVMSRGTFELLMKDLYNATGCQEHLTYWNREDYYLGKRLARLKIYPVDTRDEFGLSTFHPYNWYHLFYPGESDYRYNKYKPKCCSKRSITFQVTSSDQMHMYYYLIYRLQIFNDGKYGNQPFNSSVKDEQIWGQFLKERNIPTNISSQQYYKVWEDLIDDPNSFAQNMQREKHSDL